MSKTRILVVDDEPSVLKIIQRVLQSSCECEAVTALNGEQALQIMEGKPFDVIISDISMPGMDGSTLLNIVKELHPQTMRLVLSGRSGGNVAIQTAGTAHQFYLKPLGLRELSARIQNVLKLRASVPEDGLDRIIANVRSLPAIPDTYTALQRELSNPNASIEKVGRIIEKDIAISAKILQLVNSAFFGLSERVSKPHQAASLLGIGVLKSLVLGVHIFTEWSKKPPACFSISELWSHSLNVASASQDITLLETGDKNLADDAYSAGLFHDIGMLIMADNMPESCRGIQNLVETNKIPLIKAEQDVLGCTHAEIGAYLLSLWNFCDDVVVACAFHHQPAKSGATGFNIVAAVHAANAFDHNLHPSPAYPAGIIDSAYFNSIKLAPRLDKWAEKCGLSGYTPS
jgi:HD-like signal output (HDOD) protein/CheY-like chemotaxis protein